MAENPETHLPRDTCTKQACFPVECNAFLGSFPHFLWVSRLTLPPWYPVPSGSRSCCLALLSFWGFDLCIPIQEEHLLINYISCWEFCKSEAVLGSESMLAAARPSPCPEVEHRVRAHLDLGPCNAHPLFTWWSWCQVYRAGSSHKFIFPHCVQAKVSLSVVCYFPSTKGVCGWSSEFTGRRRRSGDLLDFFIRT